MIERKVVLTCDSPGCGQSDDFCLNAEESTEKAEYAGSQKGWLVLHVGDENRHYCRRCVQARQGVIQ